MTPPDSDAREVVCLRCDDTGTIGTDETDSEITDCPACAMMFAVSLPLSLAQRILAALELQVAREQNAGFDGTADRLHGLAAELRERLPKERK